jgi:nucleoid-associated protein
MKIEDFIIHRIDKKQRTEPTVHLRPSALNATDSRVQKFTELAVEVFKANEDKPSSVFADFHSDTTNYPFSTWCLRYFSDRLPFVKFTTDCTHRLAISMKSQPLATGGFVAFANIADGDRAKLLIVMLHPQDGLSITEKLEFEDVTHLELKHIDKAALITAPSNGKFEEKPLTYAGFRKEMSQYFQEFLGPDAFRNPNKDTHRLIQVIENFAGANGFDAGQLDEVRVKLRNYAKESFDRHEELDLEAVSAIVNPRKPKEFRMYAAGEGVSAFIKPDNGVFKRWKLIKHKSPDGLVIQFKAETVGDPGTNHRLVFNERDKTLTITKLEDELIEKIKASRTTTTQ